MPFCPCCCKKRSTKCRMVSVTVTAVFLLLLGGFLYFIYYSLFLAIIKEQTELRDGTLLFPEWVEPSQKIYVGFFFMNITNAKEFASQTSETFVKPVLDRKGPYVYRATIKKDKLQPLDTSPKEVRFRQMFSFYPEPEMTVGSFEDMITTINFFALALGPTLDYLFSQPEYENISQLQRLAAYQAVNRVIQNTNSTLLLTYPAGELLFGMQDPLLSAIVNTLNTALNGTGLEDRLPISEDFGFFKILNISAGWHTYQTYTGDNEYWLTNTITTLDNQTKLHFWYGDKCNMINGSDGTVRSPLANREDLVYHLYPSACRSTYVKYVKDTTVKRVPSWEYRPPPEMFRAPKNNSDYNDCFCESDDTEPYCIHDGGLYLAPCLYGAPLYLSAPHFLHGDGYFLSKLEGMEPPDLEEHGTVYKYEPNSGAAVAASKKIQFNLYVRPNEYVEINQRFNDSFAFPIMWLNGTYVVNDEDADLIYGLMVVSAIVVIVLQVSLLLSGFSLLSYVFYYYYFTVMRGTGNIIEKDSSSRKKEREHEFSNDVYNEQY